MVEGMALLTDWKQIAVVMGVEPPATNDMVQTNPLVETRRILRPSADCTPLGKQCVGFKLASYAVAFL
jgi:hypothetical protein